MSAKVIFGEGRCPWGQISGGEAKLPHPRCTIYLQSGVNGPPSARPGFVLHGSADEASCRDGRRPGRALSASGRGPRRAGAR